MATLEQCRTALEDLAARMSSPDASGGPQRGFDRSVSCTVTDLGVTFSGQLRNGKLTGITTDPAPRAQIRLTTTSDDLVALTAGTLSFGSAWASGRLKVDASVFDLLKLRGMM